MKSFFSLLLLFLVLACASKEPSLSPDLIPITILHTNDIHGHAWPFGKEERGGFARQLTLVKQIRKEVENKRGVVLVLSAGDANTGTPESDELKCKPDFDSMNAIGYDAMALGNHEFDRGLEQIKLQKSWAKFPFLSANVTGPCNGCWEKSAVINKSGLKIGLVGLTTDGLSKLILPNVARLLTIKNPSEAMKKEMELLSQDKVDFIIAVTHLGVSGQGTGKTRTIPNDDFKLAESAPSLPIIVGGHSHTELPSGIRAGNTLITQAGEWGRNLGRIDFDWDKNNKKILNLQAKLIPITSGIVKDPSLNKTLERHLSTVTQKFARVIGTAVNNLGEEREKVRTGESMLGNLVCDAIKEATSAQVCVFNSGGIRASISKGPISLREIYEAFPFKNTIVTTKVSGETLRALLDQGISNRHHTGSLLQVSGIRYTVGDERTLNVEVNGAELNPSAIYTLATNNFVMAGGDGLNILESQVIEREFGKTVDEVLVEYIQKRNLVKGSIEGRIRFVAP